MDDPAYPCLQVTAPFASGSSGGPLLNASGEAVGVIYGTFVNGQNMNLVVPINCLEGVALTGEGTPLASVCEAENAKKAGELLYGCVRSSYTEDRARDEDLGRHD